MDTTLPLLISAIACYLIGAFPTGKIVAHAHGVRIEQSGSGNVGATNVARTVGSRAGVITLAGDVLKGIFGVCVARGVWELARPISLSAGALEFHLGVSALAVVAGHCISIPRILTGGKGVATALGTLLTLNPLLAVIVVALFAVTFWASSLVSLSSLVAALAMPVVFLFLQGAETQFIPLAGMALLVTFRHRANIARLMAGKEPRFQSKKK